MFDEFIDYFDILFDFLSWDMYWCLFYQICYFCVIDYDYVGYFEIVKEDVDYILKQLNLDKIVEFLLFSGFRILEYLKIYYL